MVKKKIILAFLAALAYSSLSFASDFRKPYDNDGVKPKSIDESFVLVVSTGYTTTASMLINGATIQIHGVLTSTLPAGSGGADVRLRSTNTANTSSELLVPPLRLSSETRNTFYVFDPPILCPVGLSVELSSAGIFASIFYTYSATSTNANFLIPLDMDGAKSEPSMYGVQVASRVFAGATADNSQQAEALDYTTAERIVIAERAFLYGFMGSSNAVSTSFLLVEDTGSALGNPQDIFPPLFYNTLSDADVISGWRTPMFKFPWPVLLRNGIGVTNSTAGERLRVFARPARRLRY